MLSPWKIAPALAAGCTVVHKPAEFSALTARLLVETGICDRFSAMVAEKAGRIVVDHPLDPKTVVGPLIHPDHEKRVPDYIAIGQAEGATLASGGKFDGAHNRMRMKQGKIFGPVLTAIPFTDPAQLDDIALESRVNGGVRQSGHPDDPQVQRVVEDGLARIQAAGILTGDVKPAQHYLDLGATFVAAGTDVGLLTQATSRLADQFKGDTQHDQRLACPVSLSI